MVALDFYIICEKVRFLHKVLKDLYWRNWYTAIEGKSSGNSPEMVTGSNPVYKSFKLGLMSTVDRLICNQFDLMGSTPTKSTKCLYKMPVYANW